MKKICLVLFALMVCINSYGQAWDNSKPDDRFTFGLRVGANMSTFAGGQWDDYLEIKSRWGFHAGFNIDVNIVKSFAIETGLYYTVKGANMGYIYRDEGKLTYLQLPILALYRLPVAEESHIQLKAGGYAGYCIEKPETLRVKKPDVGLIAGAGISYRKFYLGLQYELGLYKIFGDDKNRNLAISLGYDF